MRVCADHERTIVPPPDILTVSGERVPETSVRSETSLAIAETVDSAVIQSQPEPGRDLCGRVEVGRQDGVPPIRRGSSAHRMIWRIGLPPESHPDRTD